MTMVEHFSGPSEYSLQSMPNGSPMEDPIFTDVFKQSLYVLTNPFGYDETGGCSSQASTATVHSACDPSSFTSSQETPVGSYGSNWSSGTGTWSAPHDFDNIPVCGVSLLPPAGAPPMFIPQVQPPAQQLKQSFHQQMCNFNFADGNFSSGIANKAPNDGVDKPAPTLSAAEVFGYRHNYYPNFDPKEYFCDTVAVDNASMVAQIVGKKGAKIKHLVAKYGTRIRTPNVDQEPVFIIKGRRSDVYSVKQEIQSAAEHFMRIEIGKRQKLDAVMNSPDSTSVKLFVPLRYVGLVIGRNGRIVREIQTTHQVYVETPKFDLRHFFRIYGTELSISGAVQAIYELLSKKSGCCFTERRQLGDEVHFLE